LANAFCPECGNRVHKSHSRGFGERLVKAITRCKVYRCHDCGWRGWLSKGKPLASAGGLRTALGLLLTILVTVLVAFYLIESYGSNTPSHDPPSLISPRLSAR
jgi:predicted RNA-binding Zn-ribbon protein involved in translation (DUF1610 family)